MADTYNNGTATDPKKNRRERIRKAFVQYFLKHGQSPLSFAEFAKSAKIKESDITAEYDSFRALETDIWTELMTLTLAEVQKDEVYQGGSVKDKLLSFYYTHLDQLGDYRTYILAQFGHMSTLTVTPYFLKGYRVQFEKFCSELIDEGIRTGEIEDRKFISDRYDRAFWVQLIFILGYWAKDSSGGLEKTDAAVEKAVNISYELISRRPAEYIVEFAKSIFRKK